MMYGYGCLLIEHFFDGSSKDALEMFLDKWAEILSKFRSFFYWYRTIEQD